MIYESVSTVEELTALQEEKLGKMQNLQKMITQLLKKPKKVPRQTDDAMSGKANSN